MTAKQWKITCAILITGSVLAALKLIFFDYTMDEEYQLMMGYRILRGDRLFREMWEPHQTSAFLCAGLMWLYRTLTGTYTGILIYLRACTTLIQIAISLYLYWSLRHSKILNAHFAMLCALIYFNIVPKIIQIPDFSNMQLWFFTLTVLCLMHYRSNREHKDSWWLVIAAGLCMALEVLAYPSCVILFPFFLVYLYRTSGSKKWRDIGLFSGVCAVSAAVWLLLILRFVNMGELVRNVQLLLSYDLTHKLSGATAGKLSGILSNLLGAAVFLLATFILSMPVMAVVRRRNPSWNKKQCIPVLMCIAVFVSECIQFILWAFMKSSYEAYQLHLFMLLLAGLLTYKYAGDLKRYLAAGILGTLLSYIAVIYISDLQMFLALPHGVLGVLFCAVLLTLALRESLGRTADRWIYFLLICLCLTCIFGKGYTMRGGRYYNVIVDTESIMKHGPAVGIFSDYMNCYIYNCNYEDYRNYIKEDDVVLIVTNMVTSAGTTPYMMAGAEVAHYSIVDPTAYDQRLLTYWGLYPQKKPNVIVVDCWYGGLMEKPDSWIMQYIENSFGYTEVVDGRYVRFYRK